MLKKIKKKNKHIMKTRTMKAKDIERNWHLIDAKDQILGRISTQIAQLLIGKHKVNYVSYLDCGDNVVVVNTVLIETTGKKGQDKKYYRHSGYPGGLKMETLSQLRKRKPEEIIKKAVWNMLPKNKLRKGRIARLHLYAGEEHPHKDKFKIK